MSTVAEEGAPTHVLRVIARLNIGGPAIQAISMTRLLQPRGYMTTLVRGSEGPDEGSMDHLAEQLGVCPLHVPSLKRDPGVHDLRALLALVWIVARQKPQIVHTHAAKAGTLGRLAVILAPSRRQRVLVHTFHGHSLSGYFSPRTARVYLAIERFLAKRTTRLIAVSEEVRDELVALGVAPAERFEVIRLGFDLSPFTAGEPERSQRATAVRAELGIPTDAHLVTLIARLVPIKRVDRFLRVAARLAERENTYFLIVGDGELRSELLASAEARALADRLTLAGFRHDIPDVCFASNVIVLTSDNEGTPVSLIEALAARTPVVSTNVGGVATVVRDEQTGLLVQSDDEEGFTAAVARLLDDQPLAGRLAAEGQRHALQTFDQERLADDLDGLYRRLLTDG
ncbi:MAG: glycosyltransferase [Solirubrobacteraceae bacterium]